MPVVPASWPMLMATEAALRADGIVSGLVRDVYIGRVAGSAALDYITITLPSESDWNLLGRRGSEGSFQIDLWCASIPRALKLYVEVARVLSGVELALGTGATMIKGETELQYVTNDPEDDTIHHGIVKYDWIVLQ